MNYLGCLYHETVFIDMTREDFNKVVEDRISSIRDVLQSKGAEYATDSERFRNFKEAGLMLGCASQCALWGMAAKHFISVKDLMEKLSGVQELVYGERTYSKGLIKEKVGDAINYLILVEGILLEQAEPEYMKCPCDVDYIDGKIIITAGDMLKKKSP